MASLSSIGMISRLPDQSVIMQNEEGHSRMSGDCFSGERWEIRGKEQETNEARRYLISH